MNRAIGERAGAHLVDELLDAGRVAAPRDGEPEAVTVDPERDDIATPEGDVARERP